MKQFVLSLAIFACLSANAQLAPTAVNNNLVKAAAPAAAVKFTTEVIDMGKIPQNKPVTVDFAFKNVSKTPLVVESASGSCGCTVPTKPEKPIMPKGSDKISATYNAAAMGAFTKTITVKFAGITEPKTLTIKGEVVAN
jgi:hypothetical protein